MNNNHKALTKNKYFVSAIIHTSRGDVKKSYEPLVPIDKTVDLQLLRELVENDYDIKLQVLPISMNPTKFRVETFNSENGILSVTILSVNLDRTYKEVIKL